MTRLAIMVTAALVAPAALSAQRLTPDWSHYKAADTWLQPPAAAGAAVVKFGHPDDYRWEGALVGGIGFGVFGVMLANSLCGYDETTPRHSCFLRAVEGLLVGGTVGVAGGGLIGGLIPKAKH